MRPSDPRLRVQLAPARGPLSGVAAFGLVTGALVIGQAWAVAGLIVAVLDDGDVLAWGVLVAALLTARGLASGAGDVLAARAAAVVSTILRHRLTIASIERRDQESSGERAVLVTRGVAATEPYLTRYLPALVLATVLPPLTLVAIASQDLLSAVIVLATLPLVPIFGALVGLATRDRAEEQWRAMAALSGHFVDVVRGLPTLVAHRRARAQSGRIAEITDRYRRATLRTLRVAFASSAVLELVATLSVALVAVTIGVRLASGSVELETALIVLLLAPEAYWPLRRVGAEFHAAAEGAATFEAADQVLRPQPQLVDRSAPPGAGLDLTDIRATYPGRATPALDLAHGSIAARGITAISGPSGCGKSTLLAAVAGLLPAEGAITADGSPVGGPSWRQQVAWLPQQPQFIAGTIGDNLRLARPDAPDRELWRALRKVALELRIEALPNGLETPLGEDGATLSAGERARLALARVVLADRPWVLLDEPTAHLDDLTERIILDTVVELGQRSSVVVVAHKPALLSVADHHIRLDPPRGRESDVPIGRRTAPSTAALAPDDEPADQGSRLLTGRGFAASTVIGALASASGVALTATAGWLIVQASTQPAVLTLLVAIVGVRTFGLARPVLRYVERLRSHDAALRLLARRRVEVYDALVPLVPARLGRRRGDLLSAVVDDVDAVVDRELRVRMPVRQAALVGLLAVILAGALLPLAGVILLTFLVAAGVGSHQLAKHGAFRAQASLIRHRSQLSAAVVESIQVADELRMWQAEDARPTGSRRSVPGWVTSRAPRPDGWGRLGPWCSTGAGAAMAGTAIVAGAAVAAGELSGPMMALLVLLPLALADVVAPVADAGALSVRTAAAEYRLHVLSRTAPAVRDTVAFGRPDGSDVEVRGARARWERGAPLTSAMNLRLAAGDRVAVVGPSGSGKSTLAALMLRFLDPVEGRVELGGQSVRNLPLDDVRRLIGLVDDHPHIFGTTLVENVRLACPSASDADVEAAIRRARLGGWLDALPEGLHTWLGDGHASVSGGERARIGIARSFLANQPVLVLDEPTAHLDHATAIELAHEVLTGERDRSVVWITHSEAGTDLVDRRIDLGEVAYPSDGSAPISSLGRDSGS